MNTVEQLDKAYKSKAILKNPALLSIWIQELKKLGIVGEEKNSLTCGIILLGGCITDNATPTSSNVWINDSAGVGKDYLATRVLKTMPQARIYNALGLTPKSLMYKAKEEIKNNPEFTWQGKILYLEDLPNNVLNDGAFKVFSSNGDHNGKYYSVNNQYPVEFPVPYKPSIVFTMASGEPNEETARRYPILNLDDSNEQTRRIKQAIAKDAVKKSKYSSFLPLAFDKLKTVEVDVPFAEDLVDLFPDNKHLRTNFTRFVDYVKFSAAIHQNQRKKTNEGVVIANHKDLVVAVLMAKQVFKFENTVSLTKTQQSVLDEMSKHVDEGFFVAKTIPEWDAHIQLIGLRQLRRVIIDLAKNGFVEKVEHEYQEGRYSAVTKYKYKRVNKFSLDIKHLLRGFSASIASTAYMSPMSYMSYTSNNKESSRIKVGDIEDVHFNEAKHIEDLDMESFEVDDL